MGVSKNRGIPKWMVHNGKPNKKWMIWGENPLFSETSIQRNYRGTYQMQCQKSALSGPQESSQVFFSMFFLILFSVKEPEVP